MLGQDVAFINLINVFGITKNVIILYNVSLRTPSQAIYVYNWDHIMSINFNKPMSNHNEGGVHSI